jgi:hypothetical protein
LCPILLGLIVLSERFAEAFGAVYWLYRGSNRFICQLFAIDRLTRMRDRVLMGTIGLQVHGLASPATMRDSYHYQLKR